MTAEQPALFVGQPSLFDGYEPTARDLELAEESADRRRTARQARDIARGVHPLTGGPLHDKADATSKRSDPPRLPYRCGTCVFRELVTSNGANQYPKCTADSGRRITHGPASDVRAWWPACPSYQEATTA